MSEDRLLMVKQLHSQLMSIVESWLVRNCNGIHAHTKDVNSDFEFDFISNDPNFRGLLNKELDNLYDFVKKNFCIHGIGCLITPHKFYFGISYLADSDLKKLITRF